MSSKRRSDMVSAQADIDLLTHDLSNLADKDPSVGEGYRVIYDRETPVELRVQDGATVPQQVGTLEALKVKIMVRGDESEPEGVTVELSCEKDLFFHYNHTCDELQFKELQESQRLMIEYPDYCNVLIRMLNSCINEPHSNLAVFVMKQNGCARLDFIQNMEYKFVELMSTDFVRSPEDMVQKLIAYRYNALKSRLQLMQNRLQEVSNIVKIKNPSLLLQLQKSVPGVGGASVGSAMSSTGRSSR